MYDGSVHARRGTIAGWHLTPDYIQNFAPGTSPSRATKLYSGSPDETEGKNIYSIETDSINIKGENSKLTIGNFLFTSNMLRVGKESPYQLVIDKNGNFGVGSVTLTSDNVISTSNFKVDKDGNVTVKSAFKVDNEGNVFVGSVSGTSSKFKIDKDGNMYVGPNGDLFNLKIDNDGNLYIAPSGESYKVAITKAGELSLGSNWQAMPYFKVTASGKVLVGPKSATETGDGNYYFELTSYGKLRCGGVTIEEFEDSGGYTYYIRLGTQATTRFSMSTTTSGNTYLRSLGRLYISASTDSAVYIGGLTFGIADNDYATYKISTNQGRVLARVV